MGREHTFKMESKCESMSQFKKRQLDRLIKLLVALYANDPASPRIRDLLAAAMGEGSSTGPLNFIKFCNNVNWQMLLREKYL